MVRVIHGCLYDKEPLYIVEQLKAVSHVGRLTRAMEAGTLQIPKTNTKYGQFAFGFRVPLQWNLTNMNLKAAVNKMQLKNLPQTSWYQQVYKFIFVSITH